MLSSLKSKLRLTRNSLIGGIANLFSGQNIDENLLEEIETRLILSDVGVESTKQLMQELKNYVKSKNTTDSATLLQLLMHRLTEILEPMSRPINIPALIKPYIILVVGVNGSGKTTTIGKLANHFKQQGKKVMLAAGDTFRAAAIEQLQVWGERNDVPVIAQEIGADSAAVLYDAIVSAQAKNIDILIADTAGRLHTQMHLMEELKKIKRTIAKIDETAPHETMLVLDANIGQNALIQAKQFKDAVGITGISITKLDGTAKGGIIFAIAKSLAIPIRFIGVGEDINDLLPFHAGNFVNALLDITQ